MSILSRAAKLFDSEGVRILHADAEIRFDVEGVGENIGGGNSNHSSLAPYKADVRTVYEGRARINVQSSGEETGKITERAEAEGLESDAVTIDVN